jgi:anaerobic selenocysteine-containing dehydrogenase
MQMFRYAEQGSIKFLWISATNPAVSLPELDRIRSILSSEKLFVVAQDIYRTETTEFADVVLPGATWGEKTGTFTNADRTVHLSEKAVDPPGDARSDLDIFLDFAARMEFTDKDGDPLVWWHDAPTAFEAWQRCSAGRPCDYTGLSYEMLRERGGVQWPCNEQAPDGTERLYVGGHFAAAPDDCESFGRDLVTGAPVEETEYRALNPDGKAVLKAATFIPPHEEPSEEFPMHLNTGRTIYHFHSRTKTARAAELNAAAPEVWAELNAADAEVLDVADGDLVDVVSPRGRIRATARIADIRRGTVFVPFHYGYWDTDHPRGPQGAAGRAANEMTITDWDPVSKQPLFKLGAARVERIEVDR